MYRFLGRIAALLVAMAAGLLLLVPTATAAPPTVQPGGRWTPQQQGGGALPIPGLLDWCSWGPVGTDSAGNKIAFTAGHCVQTIPDGAPVFDYNTKVPVGTVAYRNADIDYAVIKLNADTPITSVLPNGHRVNKIGDSDVTADPTICKHGGTTGTTCNLIPIVFSQTDTRFYTLAPAIFGDSGSVTYQGNEYIGMIRGVTLNGFEHVKFTGVLSAVAGQPNPVGKGFVPAP